MEKADSKNVLNTGRSNKMDDQSTSPKLTFGIDAILKLNRGVCQKSLGIENNNNTISCTKITDSIDEKDYHGDSESVNVDVESTPQSSDSDSEYDLESTFLDASHRHDVRSHVETSNAPYVNVPGATFSGFRSSMTAMSPGRTLFPVMSAWTSSMVSDFRKDRYSGIIILQNICHAKMHSVF